MTAKRNCTPKKQRALIPSNGARCLLIVYGDPLELDPETNHSGVKIKAEIGEVAAVFQLGIDV